MGKRWPTSLCGALWLCGLLSLGGGAPAAAQEEDEFEIDAEVYNRSGFYLQALFTNNIGFFDTPTGLGPVFTNLDPAEGPVGFQAPGAQYSTGVYGAFGYRLSPLFAAEIGGDWVTGWQPEANPASTPGSPLNLTAGAFGLNGRVFWSSLWGAGRYQLSSLFGLNAVVMQDRNGVGASSLSSAQWDFGVRIAPVTLDWYINEEVGLSLQPMLVIPTGANPGISELYYFSIGIGGFLRFGEY